MDISIEYTEEEKKLFEEINILREEVHVLEDEVYLLKKEKAEHTEANHTQGIPPIVYMVLSFFFFLIFAADIIVGFGMLDIHIDRGETFANLSLSGGTALAIGIASCAPAVGIFFAVLFFTSYRKYFYQVTKDPKKQKRAAELNITNYYVTEERIDRDYREASSNLERKKKIYTEKKNRLDELMTLRRIKEVENAKHAAEEAAKKPKPELKVIRYHSMTESRDTEEKPKTEEKPETEEKPKTEEKPETKEKPETGENHKPEEKRENEEPQKNPAPEKDITGNTKTSKGKLSEEESDQTDKGRNPEG